MSLKNPGWWSKKQYLKHTHYLAPSVRNAFADEFLEWIQQKENLLDPDVRKQLAKDLRKGRVFPNLCFLEKHVYLPRGGAPRPGLAVYMQLTREQLLFWVNALPKNRSFRLKLARFRNPDDIDLVSVACKYMAPGDLAFFAELESNPLESNTKLAKMYKSRIQGACCLDEAIQRLDELSLSQLRFWFAKYSPGVHRTKFNRAKDRAEKRATYLARGALSIKEAEKRIEELTVEHLTYWANTGCLVFEAQLLFKSGGATSREEAKTQIFHQHRVNTWPGAEEMIMGQDSQSAWKDAMVLKRISVGKWRGYSSRTLRLVAKHHPVEDNDFYPLGLLLNKAGCADEDKDRRRFRVFRILLGLCRENPRTPFLATIAATKPQKWLDALLDWTQPAPPDYTE